MNKWPLDLLFIVKYLISIRKITKEDANDFHLLDVTYSQHNLKEHKKHEQSIIFDTNKKHLHEII